MIARRILTLAALLVAPACAVATVDDNAQPVGGDDDDRGTDDVSTGGTSNGGLVGGGNTTGAGGSTSGAGTGGSTSGGGTGGATGGSTSGGGTSSGGGGGGAAACASAKAWAGETQCNLAAGALVTYEGATYAANAAYAWCNGVCNPGTPAETWCTTSQGYTARPDCD